MHLDTHALWIQQAVRTRSVDLRKVDGEKNPADLLSKHSISRLKLEERISLYGCKFIWGRADANRQIGAMDEVPRAPLATRSSSGSQAYTHEVAVMPHIEHSASNLDKLYHSIATPKNDGLNDYADESNDVVLQHDTKIVAQIQLQSEMHGRRRRPAPPRKQPISMSQCNDSGSTFTLRTFIAMGHGEEIQIHIAANLEVRHEMAAMKANLEKDIIASAELAHKIC